MTIVPKQEGICENEILENVRIYCNFTCSFSKVQAIAHMESNTTLILLFMKWILDWYKAQMHLDLAQSHDQDLQYVVEIFNHYKYFNHKIEIINASFNNIEKIIALFEWDLLIIGSILLNWLNTKFQKVETVFPGNKSNFTKLFSDKKNFCHDFNQNIMAMEKFSKGNRIFSSNIKD
jgi:transaldolase